MLFERVFRTAAATDPKTGLTLIDAGRGAYQKALSEGLPLAHIAEQSGRPQYWFANNILHVVDVHGQRPAETTPVLLTRDLIGSLKLAEDMLAIVDPDDGAEKFGELMLSKEQFERYLAWARTVY